MNKEIIKELQEIKALVHKTMTNILARPDAIKKIDALIAKIESQIKPKKS